LVSLLFAAILAWYFARPIRNLRDAFKSVAAGRLETRIGSSMGRRNDELADLGEYFDHMAGRLQNLIETQRRLLHDVSHELRSPLARLQAAADLMRQQPDRGAEFAERIQRDTARMDALVGELLTLARLDAGMTGNLDEEVDLQEIVADITDDARFEADSKGCSLRVDMEDLAIVRGNHELLYRAIENVVRNAVRHSPQGQTVEISTHRVGESLRVVVADRGQGVSADDLAAIFEPFVRSGLARSPTGYGLGLAITRRVAEAHGGTVFAANRPEGGLFVTFELPFGSERLSAPIG
jgi:signal transduction histidine kinase